MIGAITAGFLGGAGAAVLGDYESISTVTLASAQSSIDFTSIPSGYSHLQVRMTSLNSAAGDVYIQFNSDTTGNYWWHFLAGNGAAASASNSAAAYTRGYLGYAGGTAANPFTTVVDILDYTSTTKNKTVRNLMGNDNNGSGYVILASTSWSKTPEAINKITIYNQSGNFNQYSSFALYGVK